MNAFFGNLAAARNNPLVLYPVLLCMTLSVVAVFLPDSYHTKISVAEKMLLGYAVAAAANSGPNQKPQEEPKQPDPKQ